MKRERLSKKAIVKQRIEIRNGQSFFLNAKGHKTMNEGDRLGIYGLPKKTVVPIIELLKDATEESYKPKVVVYQKKAFVDFDVVICIPSYNRYEKVKRLISQFYEQPTKYTFKIVILNDGSTDLLYDSLITDFPNIEYVKNDMPNGKVLHWYCYNQLWEFLRTTTCHTVLQMDDDFIICGEFLNKIVDLFFEEKEKDGSMMAIAPHLWSFKPIAEKESWWKYKDFVDGIALLDDAVIKHMKYQMKPVDIIEVSKPGTPVRAWTQVSSAIKRLKGWIYRTPDSYVYHDGNNDSKLHGNVRDSGNAGVYTQRYIGKL